MKEFKWLVFQCDCCSLTLNLEILWKIPATTVDVILAGLLSVDFCLPLTKRPEV